MSDADAAPASAVLRVDWLPGSDRLRGLLPLRRRDRGRGPGRDVGVAARPPRPPAGGPERPAARRAPAAAGARRHRPARSGPDARPRLREEHRAQHARRGGPDAAGRRAGRPAPRASSSSTCATRPARDLPAWAPGAHIDLRLPDGLVRQYSLCGDPADRSALADRRAARAGEPGRVARTCTTPSPRAPTSRCAGPRNHFPLAPAPRYVFVAGGIGITPILPMIDAADAAGARLGAALRRPQPPLDGLPASRCEEATGDRVDAAPAGRGRPDRPRRAPGRPASRTRWSTAAGPSRCWSPSSSAAPAGRAGSLHVERFAPKDVGEPVLHRRVRGRARRSADCR